MFFRKKEFVNEPPEFTRVVISEESSRDSKHITVMLFEERDFKLSKEISEKLEKYDYSGHEICAVFAQTGNEFRLI